MRSSWVRPLLHRTFAAAVLRRRRDYRGLNPTVWCIEIPQEISCDSLRLGSLQSQQKDLEHFLRLMLTLQVLSSLSAQSNYLLKQINDGLTICIFSGTCLFTETVLCVNSRYRTDGEGGCQVQCRSIGGGWQFNGILQPSGTLRENIITTMQ